MRPRPLVFAMPPAQRRALPAVRLDGLRQPYGPCPAALEAADAPGDDPLPALAAELRQRLARTHRISPDLVSLFPSSRAALRHVVERSEGPLVSFAPSAATESFLAHASAREVLTLARGPGREASVPLDLAMDLPPNSIAIVDSPSDPLGALLAASDAVRLARACRFLIVDERYAELAGFSLLHLSAEFDNIAIVRSFEYWAAIDDPPCAWVAASARASAALALQDDVPRREALAAASATLADLGTVHATLRLLREERSRLYRFLRKLSFLEPIPSWGPFLAARVNLVPRERVVVGLANRLVHIHAPDGAGLERIVRISIGSRSAMDRLRAALLDLATELFA